MFIHTFKPLLLLVLANIASTNVININDNTSAIETNKAVLDGTVMIDDDPSVSDNQFYCKFYKGRYVSVDGKELCLMEYDEPLPTSEEEMRERYLIYLDDKYYYIQGILSKGIDQCMSSFDSTVQECYEEVAAVLEVAVDSIMPKKKVETSTAVLPDTTVSTPTTFYGSAKQAPISTESNYEESTKSGKILDEEHYCMVDKGRFFRSGGGLDNICINRCDDSKLYDRLRNAKGFYNDRYIIFENHCYVVNNIIMRSKKDPILRTTDAPNNSFREYLIYAYLLNKDVISLIPKLQHVTDEVVEVYRSCVENNGQVFRRGYYDLNEFFCFRPYEGDIPTTKNEFMSKYLVPMEGIVYYLDFAHSKPSNGCIENDIERCYMDINFLLKNKTDVPINPRIS